MFDLNHTQVFLFLHVPVKLKYLMSEEKNDFKNIALLYPCSHCEGIKNERCWLLLDFLYCCDRDTDV